MMCRGRLLVVDDELFVRELLAEYFTRQSFTVDTAEDGDTALKLLEQNDYEAALIDLKMPRMDGVELLRAIRAIDRGLQVVMMTGYPTVESAVGALRGCACDYVVKPFRLNELESTILAAMRRTTTDDDSAMKADPYWEDGSTSRRRSTRTAEPALAAGNFEFDEGALEPWERSTRALRFAKTPAGSSLG
jgi:DNA-binding response OmpR family regulator